MTNEDTFWKLAHFSDRQLLESLGAVLHTQRRSLAELVAHLGEVEERRLHLQAACSSMFAYCVGRLHMSEDEAVRRIELARLARKFPALYAELAGGRLTLSAALVLKPVLSADNHLELLAAARGASTEQARELVAARFPRPDAPSCIRKLPERRPVTPAPAGAPTAAGAPAAAPAAAAPAAAAPAAPAAAAPAAPAAAAPVAPATAAAVAPATAAAVAPVAAAAVAPVAAAAAALAASAPAADTGSATGAATPSLPSPASLAASGEPSALPAPAPAPAAPLSLAPAGTTAARSRIEPLSAERYKVVFTADAELKRKLELARGLLRHAHPSGDFAALFSRALDLLLDELLKSRFGAGARRRASSARKEPRSAPPAAAGSRPTASPSSSSAPPSPPSTPSPTTAPTAPSVPSAPSPTTAPTAPSPPLPSAPSPTTAPPSRPPPPTAPTAPSPTTAPSPPSAPPPTTSRSAPCAAPSSCPPSPASAAPSPSAPSPTTAPPSPSAPPPPSTRRHAVATRAARRAVLERDGLGCSWVDAHGVRCGSRAWLELDHRHPAGQGGDSEPDNLRWLCRAHNRFAAERAYGRAHIERATRARRRRPGARDAEP